MSTGCSYKKDNTHPEERTTDRAQQRGETGQSQVQRHSAGKAGSILAAWATGAGSGGHTLGRARGGGMGEGREKKNSCRSQEKSHHRGLFDNDFCQEVLSPSRAVGGDAGRAHMGRAERSARRGSH